MSEFYIYNASSERIGLLQHVDSVQWLESYQRQGEAKIDARVTEQNLLLLAEGNRVYNPDSDTVARISHIDIVETEAEAKITARADLTAELLSDRVVMGTETVTNIEAGMYGIYSRNRRGLPAGIAAAAGYAQRTDTEFTWGTVLDAELKLAELSGLGFKVVFDPATGDETFKVYQGMDRSGESSPGYCGYFGTDVGNIQNVAVTSGTTSYKNVAIVAGTGEESTRPVRTVSLGTVSGENRRELFVEARDLQREYQVATPTGGYDEKGNPLYEYETRTYTDAEYNAMLDARGLQKLAEQLKDFSITCDIEQTNIAYGADYFLGDRVPVKLPEYGVYASARIDSVTMVYEKEGQKIIALLSEFELEDV